MKSVLSAAILAVSLVLCGCETAPLFRGYRCYCRGAYAQSIAAMTYYLEHSHDRDGNKEERAAGFFYRGLSKTELGRSREAIADYEEALARIPDFFYASFNLGVEHVRLREYDKALPALRMAWTSMLKAGKGELEESQLWNRKVFPRDQAYGFYYYGMTAVMCGAVNELGTLLHEADSIAFPLKCASEARETFRRIASGALTLEEGRHHVESWLKGIESKMAHTMR